MAFRTWGWKIHGVFLRAPCQIKWLWHECVSILGYRFDNKRLFCVCFLINIFYLHFMLSRPQFSSSPRDCFRRKKIYEVIIYTWTIDGELMSQRILQRSVLPVPPQRSCNPDSVSLAWGACDEQRLTAAHNDCDTEWSEPSGERLKKNIQEFPVSVTVHILVTQTAVVCKTAHKIYEIFSHASPRHHHKQ